MSYGTCVHGGGYGFSGNGFRHINEVTLRRARLVLGWMTVSGFNSRCGIFISVCDSNPGQLSLTISSWVGAVSTSQRVVTPYGCGVKADMGVDHGGDGGTSPPRIWSGGR